MATPITWRNVNSATPNVTGLLDGASNSFNNSTRALQNIIDQQQATQAANTQTTSDNFIQSVLSGYKDPNSLQTAIQTGAIDQLAKENAAVVNAGDLLNRANSQVGALRDSVTSKQQFDTEQQRVGNRDFINHLMAQANEGDPEGAIAAIQADPSRFVDPAGEIKKIQEAYTTGNAFKETRQKKEALAYLEETINALVPGKQDALNQLSAIQKELDSGIPLSPERRKELEALKPELQKQSEGLTYAAKNKLLAEVSRMSGGQVSPEQSSALIDARFAAFTAESPETAAQLNAQQAKLDKAYEIDTNIFHVAEQAKQDPVSAANQVAARLQQNNPKFADWYANNENRTDFAKKAATFIGKGIDINGTSIEITPAFMELVLSGASNDFWAIDNTDFDKMLKNAVRDNDFIKGQYKTFLEHRKNSDIITEARTSHNLSVLQNVVAKPTSSSKKSRGVEALDHLIKQQKPKEQKDLDAIRNAGRSKYQ